MVVRSRKSQGKRISSFKLEISDRKAKAAKHGRGTNRKHPPFADPAKSGAPEKSEGQFGIQWVGQQAGNARRELPCASLCKTCRNRGWFFFESGIESSIESGYVQIPRAESKRVALIQSDSGGDDGTRIAEMEFKHC